MRVISRYSKILLLSLIMAGLIVLINIYISFKLIDKRNKELNNFENTFNRLIVRYNKSIDSLNKNSKLKSRYALTLDEISFLKRYNLVDIKSNLVESSIMMNKDSFDILRVKLNNKNKLINIYIEEITNLTNESKFI